MVRLVQPDQTPYQMSEQRWERTFKKSLEAHTIPVAMLQFIPFLILLVVLMFVFLFFILVFMLVRVYEKKTVSPSLEMNKRLKQSEKRTE